MTTIAALALDGTVYVAADTCTNVYDRPIYGAAQKIRRHPVGAGEALLAYCGDGGLPDAVAAHLTVDAPEPDAELQPWAHAVAEAITGIARDQGYFEDGHLDGSVLLGYRGRIWTLSHAKAIPHPDGIGALGSGEGPAIGALDAMLTHGSHAESGANAVVNAVGIAIKRDRYSAEPIQFEVLDRP